MTRPTGLGFSAGWRTTRNEPSLAHLVGPRPSEFGTQAPYIAVYVGGHDGVRVSIDDPDTADQLARLLTEAAARFRAARDADNADDPDTWDEDSFTGPDLGSDTAGRDPAPGVAA